MPTDTSPADDEPVAVVYEFRTLATQTERVVVDWREYVEKLPKSGWKNDEERTTEVRNERKLVYGDNLDADDVAAYHYEFEATLTGTVEKLSVDDPRGSDRLNWVKPLAPVESAE